MQILKSLKKSKFRNSFNLTANDKLYLNAKGLNVIQQHAYNLLSKRIQRKLKNDGKQTPWNGHPVFVAQHATATCCRKCIEKWHNIRLNKVMDDQELEFCVNLVMGWIKEQ